MDENLVSLILKLPNIPFPQPLQLKGRKVDMTYKQLVGRDLNLEDYQLRQLAVLFQYLNTNTFSDNELTSLASYNLNQLDLIVSSLYHTKDIKSLIIQSYK